MSREDRRLHLQSTLESIPGINKVYFQPPASISMKYPCIVFSFETESKLHADDVPYLVRDRYTITLITKDHMPEEMIDAILSIPYTKFDRHYTSDNLHHFSYTTESFERLHYV